MKNLPEPRDHIELDELLSRYCDGTLDREGQIRIAAILEEDAEARRHYIHYLDLHLDLARRAEVSKLAPIAPSGATTPLSKRNWQVLTLAAVAMFFLGIAGPIVWMSIRPSEDATDQGPTATEAQDGPVAFISQADSVEWSRPEAAIPGMELKPGSIDLVAGKLRIDFFDGTAVTVVGPASFSIDGADQLFLRSGQSAIRTAEATDGFVLRTPDAVFVDIGTEYCVNVDASRKSQLFVNTGEVVATLISEDGAPIDELAATEGQSLEVDLEEGITEAELEKTNFAVMLEAAPLPLQVTEVYVNTVVKANPIGYWRFQSIQNKLIPDEIGGRHHALSLGRDILEGGQGNRVILFDDGDAERGLLVNDPFESFPAGSNYSIELWMNPQSNQPGALISLVELDTEDLDQAKRTPPRYRMTAIECTPVDPGHWVKAPAGKIGFFHHSRTSAGGRIWDKNRSRSNSFKDGKSRKGEEKKPHGEYDRDDDHKRHVDREKWRGNNREKWRGNNHEKWRTERDDEHGHDRDHRAWQHWRGKRDHESRVYSRNRYTPGSWHHVVAVRKPDQILLYINGVLEATAEAESSSDIANLRVIIGRYSLASGGFGRPFVGRIDEIALYNRALSENEIREHYELVGEDYATASE